MRAPEIGTATIVRSHEEPSYFYVGRRKGSHAPGTLSLPGGCMDPQDRSPFLAATREVREEMRVEGFAWKSVPHWRWDTFPDTDRRFLCVYYDCILKKDEKPVVMEPHKVEKWELRRWEGDLQHEDPNDLFGGVYELGLLGFLR